MYDPGGEGICDGSAEGVVRWEELSTRSGRSRLKASVCALSAQALKDKSMSNGTVRSVGLLLSYLLLLLLLLSSC